MGAESAAQPKQPITLESLASTLEEIVLRLDSFTTKQDFNRFATREDLHNFALEKIA